MIDLNDKEAGHRIDAVFAFNALSHIPSGILPFPLEASPIITEVSIVTSAQESLFDPDGVRARLFGKSWEGTTREVVLMLFEAHSRGRAEARREVVEAAARLQNDHEISLCARDAIKAFADGFSGLAGFVGGVKKQ